MFLGTEISRWLLVTCLLNVFYHLLVKTQRPSSLAVPAAGEPGLWTSQGDAEVKLRMGESGVAAETPLTVNQMFTATVERFGDYKALSWKDGEQQKSLTYREYYQSCRTAAKSFMKVDFYLLSSHSFKEQLNKKGSKHCLYRWILLLLYCVFFVVPAIKRHWNKSL